MGLGDTLLDRSVLLGYSKVGYRLRSRSWKQPAPDELAGRVVAVTGANAGLGLATARGAASLGAHVRMLCRDEARASAARARLLSEVPGAEVEIDVCDVSSLSSVRSVAARLRDEVGALHALVHNAGVLPPVRSESVDGHELTLATHVLGPHLLTSLVRPLLVSDGDARVVFVSSGGMYSRKLELDDLESRSGGYHGAVAYARTKRMQVVLAELWARRLAGQGVSVHSMHPGWAETPGVSSSLPRFDKVMRPLLRTPEEGCDTAVWLMYAPASVVGSGRFWHDRTARPVDYLPMTKATEAQKQALWDFCESAVTAADS